MAATVINASPATIDYHALMGTYGRVHYFVTKAPLRDVAENLELAPQMELPFSERIQRIINEQRVTNEILPYLRQNELRFFNALVCILLPDADNNEPFWDFDEYTDEHGHGLGGLGRLKIAKRVSRVVLDGQHRFEALRRFWQEKKSNPDGPDSSIEVALIFVVVDELGRFRTKDVELRSKTITAVRNLFAVLNKTARKVDKTTLLLIDDTDITNVITRRLLDEDGVDETFVKWTGAENLKPNDAFFTTIHVVRDAVRFYLRDYQDALAREYGSEEERNEILQQLFYDSPRGFEISVQKGIPEIFNSSRPFSVWKQLTRTLQITFELQPTQTALNRDQARAVKQARDKQLAFTVAGQRAFFRAIIEGFVGQKRRNLANLRRVVHRANVLFDRNLFSRVTAANSPFLGVLLDTKGRMNWAESVVELAGRILGHAIGSGSEKGPILDEFEEVTERDPSIVEGYWKEARTLWTE